MRTPKLGLYRSHPGEGGTWREKHDAAEAAFGAFAGHWATFHPPGSLPLLTIEEQALADGKRLHVLWQPYPAGQHWAYTAAGSYNTQVDQVAADLKAQAPRQIWVTLDPEPEALTTGATGNFSYQAYKDMWATVRGRFDTLDVGNVTWVWAMQSSIANPTHALNLWPGNSLVDVTAFQEFISCATSAELIALRWLQTLQWLRDQRTTDRAWSDVDGKWLAITAWGADQGTNLGDCGVSGGQRGTGQHRAAAIAAARTILGELAASRVLELRYWDTDAGYLQDLPAVDAAAFGQLKQATEITQTLPVAAADVTPNPATPEDHADWHTTMHATLAETPAAPAVSVTSAGHLGHHDALHALGAGMGLSTSMAENDPNHPEAHRRLHEYAAGTRPAFGIGGGGYQNGGGFAPAGVGHDWYAVSGGDVGGWMVTDDNSTWRPANRNLLQRNKQRCSSFQGSFTVPNRMYAYASAADGTGANGGHLLRGTYDPATGLIDWVTVVTFTQGATAGSVGDDHPRQVGRTLALDEANDTAVLGTINGVAVVSGISGAAGSISYRALTGAQVTGVVLDPTDTNLCYCTADNDGAANTAGLWRITNIRTGTVTTARYSFFTNPQDICLATVAGTRYCWVAAANQGIWRWTVSSDITSGWTDLTGTLPTTQGWAGVDVLAGAALGSTKVVVSSAETGQNSVDAGAVSADGGSTWSRESQAWTKSNIPIGQDADWWLGIQQPSALLDGNTYECECPRFDPANSNVIHFHGRSGVWRTVDGGSFWQPTIYGQCVTGAFAVAPDPTNPARVVTGDNDWTMFRTLDRFLSMAVQQEPGGVSSRSVFAFMFRGSGRLAIAAGDAPTNVNGEVYTTDDPWAATVTYTSQGFGAAGGGNRCRAVAIGQNGSGTEVLLAMVEGSGLYRKLGAAAPTLVSSLYQYAVGNPLPRFWWPHRDGGTHAAYVYCSTAGGLLRSTDYGATWAKVGLTYTSSYEYCGNLAGDPSNPDLLYVTLDDGGATNVGLYKITAASTTATFTKIGPTLDPPGQVAVHPVSGIVYVCATGDTPGGPKLYRSPAANPGPSDTFLDITDDGWRSSSFWLKEIAVATDGALYAANAVGGYFMKQT